MTFVQNPVLDSHLLTLNIDLKSYLTMLFSSQHTMSYSWFLFPLRFDLFERFCTGILWSYLLILSTETFVNQFYCSVTSAISCSEHACISVCLAVRTTYWSIFHGTKCRAFVLLGWNIRTIRKIKKNIYIYDLKNYNPGGLDFDHFGMTELDINFCAVSGGFFRMLNFLQLS
jgi:hypothetical protein